MPENLNKRRILDYLNACYAGDIERASSYYDDDIDFIAYAPIEIFPTLGQKRGKAAMTRSLVGMRAMYRLIEYEVTSIVAEGDRVALMLDLRLSSRDGDRVISLQIGQLLHAAPRTHSHLSASSWIRSMPCSRSSVAT